MRRTALILLSGGVDSIACAHLLRAQGFEVNGLFLDYGQAAARPEQRSAEALARHVGLPLEVASLASSQNFSAGEVVGRNAFFVFSALMLSRARSDLIVLGVHAGTAYYDCSSAFVEAMHRLVAEHTDGRVAFNAPFSDWTKRDVYEYFRSTNIPASLTYSCEAGTEPPCGNCLSCQDRGLL